MKFLECFFFQLQIFIIEIKFFVPILKTRTNVVTGKGIQVGFESKYSYVKWCEVK
jgi:hypothetical protein